MHVRGKRLVDWAQVSDVHQPFSLGVIEVAG
jgi:hypothetical protein